jgi:hypothetical protein
VPGGTALQASGGETAPFVASQLYAFGIVPFAGKAVLVSVIAAGGCGSAVVGELEAAGFGEREHARSAASPRVAVAPQRILNDRIRISPPAQR